MAAPTGRTPNLQLPYPIPDDDVDVPRDVKALADAMDPLGAGYVPVGSMTMWQTSTPPQGWLLCNGQQVSAATYPALAALLGSSGGNVTLPDLRDRFPVGAGATALGGTGGAAAVTLTAAQSGAPAHSHPDNIAYAAGGTHSHVIDTNGNYGTKQPVPPPTAYFGEFAKNSGTHVGSTNDSGSHTHTKSGGVQSNAAVNASQSHENRPPYIAINFIMRAG